MTRGIALAGPKLESKGVVSNAKLGTSGGRGGGRRRDLEERVRTRDGRGWSELRRSHGRVGDTETTRFEGEEQKVDVLSGFC